MTAAEASQGASIHNAPQKNMQEICVARGSLQEIACTGKELNREIAETSMAYTCGLSVPMKIHYNIHKRLVAQPMHALLIDQCPHTLLPTMLWARFFHVYFWLMPNARLFVIAGRSSCPRPDSPVHGSLAAAPRARVIVVI